MTQTLPTRGRPTDSILGRGASGAALALLSCAALSSPAFAQANAADPGVATVAPPSATTAAPDAASAAAQTSDSQTDIFSPDTLSLMVDARLAVANGHASWIKGGFGKTRFQGGSSGGFKPQVDLAEVDIVWNPRFTGALSANVSAAWQHDHHPGFDLMEAFIDYLPQQKGRLGVSARAGLMWPEISLEHSTGGAWSVVNTITPSAINAWVGEEVKVVGLEGTLHASLGEHELSATAGVFGWNDTSGTLLSFRGWALHDEKATVSGEFPLPALNAFIAQLQQDKTRSTDEIDHRPGFYGRLDWRPPAPFGVALFYYDNEGDPQAFTPAGQWGWRTRFWNLGLNADVAPNTRLLAQAMTGSTTMGFKINGVRWVDTDFSSAYALVTHSFGDTSLTGRVETFRTREHGSAMPSNNSEDGWAITAAGRYNLSSHTTLLAEILNVHSRRGTRVSLGGLSSPSESQTVVQVSLRYRL